MTAVVIIEGAVILLLALLVAGLLKSHAEILRQLDALSTGSGEGTTPRREQVRTTGLGKAPSSEIVGVDPEGMSTSVTLEHGRGETLLAFLSTGCASCLIFWDELGSGSKLPTSATRPVIVTKGPDSESPSKVRQLAPAGTRIVMSSDAWDEYRVPLTPYFMLVGSAGEVIGEGSATDMGRLVDMFGQADADANPTRLGTKGRERHTDGNLSRSGVEPGDPSLYEDPLR